MSSVCMCTEVGQPSLGQGQGQGQVKDVHIKSYNIVFFTISYYFVLFNTIL